MTREEAIRIATGLRTDFKCESDTMVEFCNIIIKALEQDKSVEQTNGIIAELEKIKIEIQDLIDFEESCCGNTILGYECLSIINNRISELKGENK